jgi:hypothetical protein
LRLTILAGAPWVPRFFFDLRADDGAMEPDDEGVVLESVEAACAEAARAAATMLKDRAEIGTGPNSSPS